MIENFIIDVETLGTQDKSVVLSVAILHFDTTNSDITYEQLVDKCLYVKFDALEQKEKGRKVDPKTLEWWQKQPSAVRDLCLKPSKKDVGVVEGIQRIKDYISHFSKDEYFVWARGSLDQRVLESLCLDFDIEPIAPYNMFMDVRTAIRLIKNTSDVKGYCNLPDMYKNIGMQAHNPIDDIIRDTLMLTLGE